MTWKEDLNAADIAILFNNIAPEYIHLRAEGKRLQPVVDRDETIFNYNEIVQRKLIVDVFTGKEVIFQRDDVNEHERSLNSRTGCFFTTKNFDVEQLLKRNKIAKKSDFETLKMSHIIKEIGALAEPFKDDPDFLLAVTSHLSEVSPSAIKQGALASLFERTILKKVEDVMAGTKSPEQTL